MTDCWMLYKQIPEDYKVVSIFPSIENGGFDYNSISFWILFVKIFEKIFIQ